MNRLIRLSDDPVLGPYLPALIDGVERKQSVLLGNTGQGAALGRILATLPAVTPTSTDVDRDRIRIGDADDLDADQHRVLHFALRRLKPWRKGPFDIFGIGLDSEWNSALKWNRLADHLEPQTGRRVLDIGASCGYYLFRMAARQPALVMGIEPYLAYYGQFLALSRYLALPPVHGLPLALEELPALPGCFDTVLCMGFLYHRRSPLDTLQHIHQLMAPGGQLVLETLIIEGEEEMALFPRRRYAKMKNIFFIPTIACLRHWLTRTGFDEIRCVDVSPTTPNEQRRTEWTNGESLADFLDPKNPARTIEGYPAPVRAMMLAKA